MKDFKIYIPVKDEECLIAYTVGALKQVFDPSLIEVLDLESQDRTVSRVPSGVKVTTVVLPKSTERDPSITGAAYTQMKNEYSRKQEWVLWVDGDEIYPVSTSKAIVDWVSRAQSGDLNRISDRLYWRVLKEGGGRKYQSREFLSAGPKVFNSRYQGFRRAWPKEVTYDIMEHESFRRHKKEFTGLWFWHGVLLKRSNNKEPTWRRKKREVKHDIYSSLMTWEEIDRWPWEDGYGAAPLTDWVVVNLHLHSGNLDRWEGRF
jgi:hypothetical protein